MNTINQKNKLFFTSVPKAGKNVLQSFLFKLKFSRFDLNNVSREAAVHQSYLAYFQNMEERATYALPMSAEGSRQNTDWQLFISDIKTMPERSFIHHHFAFDKDLQSALSQQDVPIVFLYRDPRDILLSMANYCISQSKPDHLMPKLSGLSLEEIMIVLLNGATDLVPFASYLDSFTGWLAASDVLSLRFEDVIGPDGGGTVEAQQTSFLTLARHMGFTDNDPQIDSAISNAFNRKAGTFFKGQIGGWKEMYSERVKQSFNELAGHLLADWGYV